MSTIRSNLQKMVGMGKPSEFSSFEFNPQIRFSWCNQHTYVNTSIEQLLGKVIKDVISKLEGVDPEVDDLLKGVGEHSFIRKLIELLVTESEYIYMVEVDGVIELSAGVVEDSVKVANPLYNINTLLRDKIISIYNLDRQRAFMIQSSSNMVLTLEGLRFQPDKRDGNHKYDADLFAEMSSQVKAITSGITKGSSVLVLDVKDELKPVALDINPHTQAINALREDIANVIGIPMTYLYGVSSTGLNSNGEGDREQYYKALETFFANYLTPVLVAIYEMKGLKLANIDKITMRWGLTDNIKELFDTLLTMEAITTLTPEEKEYIKGELLNRYGLLAPVESR